MYCLCFQARPTFGIKLQLTCANWPVGNLHLARIEGINLSMHLTVCKEDVEARSVRRAAMPRKNYHPHVFVRPQHHVLCSSWFESLPRPPLTTCQNINAGPFKGLCCALTVSYIASQLTFLGPPHSRSIATRISPLIIYAQTAGPCRRRRLTTDLDESLSLRLMLALPSVASPTSSWYLENCHWFKVLPSKPLF